VPNTLTATRTYTSVVTTRARFIAFGKSRAGLRMSPTANVITLKPRKAKNVSATLATMSDTGG
jgi:hypothetical protein